MRFLSALFMCCLFSVSVRCQINITQGMTPDQYVNDILLGEGINASNVQFTGLDVQLGHLTNGNNIPIENGLILSSADATNPGTCAEDMPGALGGVVGEPDLLTVANSVPPLIGQIFSVSSVNDVCILEFDFEATGDSISFNYIFGSDEYLNWVNSSYNDIFAFFLSGPGITGPYASPLGFPNGSINIAQVPNSNPELPITISSVNDITNSEYYIDNPLNEEICINGYTQIFTASSQVQCGETYHIKLAIADGSDDYLESFVILEEGSFNSNAIDIVADASIEGADVFLGDTTVVEGCNDATFTVIRPDNTTLDTIFLNIYGSAIPGIDFSNDVDIVVMEPGQSSADITLGVINDNIAEGPELITIEYVYVNGCGDTVITSATIMIMDPNPITLVTDQIGCMDEDNGITLSVNAITGFEPFEYQWDTDPGDTDPSFYYETDGASGSANVVVTDICGSISDASISWQMLEEFVGDNETICLGQGSIIPAYGGTQNPDNTPDDPGDTPGYSDILTQVEDSDGNVFWNSIFGIDTIISVDANTNQVTGLYDGGYATGTEGIGTIELQLIDGCGSIAYSTITIEICQIEFFNVFTPNGDGDNEQFRIIGLQGYPYTTFNVYDRWGLQVYENLNYSGSWNGEASEGFGLDKNLSSGVYYFVLRVPFDHENKPLEDLFDEDSQNHVNYDLSEPGIVIFTGSITLIK